MLDKVKYAFFDFDDTLCVHLNHEVNMTSKTLEQEITFGGKNFYLDPHRCRPSKAMHKLLRELKERDIPAHCITWADHSGWCKPKQEFLDKNYPQMVLDTIATGSRNAKIEYIGDFCRFHEILPCEVLLVEDHPETIDEAAIMGITVMSASEVSIMYE